MSSGHSFNHLHVHTQFSLLDGAADISKLYDKAIADGMKGMAITDHGNMFGVFKFVAEAWKRKDGQGNPLVKPIIGCEFYVVQDRHRQSFSREEKDIRYHQLMLAKNEEGYRNLCKLTSLGYMEGMYGKYPRIDKELILQYHKGLIATTCCLGAEVPKAIMQKTEEEAEAVFKWWLDLFGEDYYIEIQRHHIPDQEKVNAVLLKWAQKYQVPLIASNDSHYVNQQDSNAHDILLCINTGEKKSTPTIKEFGDDDMMSKGKRFAFYNDQFFFKTGQEMGQLFKDLPQALERTQEIVDKVDTLNLEKQILLPNFPIPEGFANQDAYLRHITFKGAKERYGEISAEVEERLNFELFTVEQMGFAGYFLIVSDFIDAGRKLGVLIGPGRGSAAGSAVAYCIGITNIDPIKYDLLFERFLNPERKSMPDIDTDFDDAGRQKVIDYVVDKYGKNQVAHIITYGSMAAKMSIKDVARVMDLPISDSNALSKLVPEKPGISLKRILRAPEDGKDGLKDNEKLSEDELKGVRELRKLLSTPGLNSDILKEAELLEGSVRNTGIHAAGIIIAPSDLNDLIPVATAKDTDLLVTQYDGSIIENAGVIKMDFLGLKTLSILKYAIELIQENHRVTIDLDSIPLDDSKTFELYQKGETNATFQFESVGMQKYLRELKPDKLEDLIAMNALYRPGPIEYIPEFVARKHGRKSIVYDLPDMEEFLNETYGITVYQEQVMLLSQKLAGFTKGQADTLRKAMGKKQKAVLDQLKGLFMEGCEKNGHPAKVCEKVWTDWEAFASYAFNKSHSTCYAYVAYQTAYLKAHYPAEYMASVLSNNLSNSDKLIFFMEECRRMGLTILGPNVNESITNFSVNANGEIRFGLGAIKNVGEAAMEGIIQERKTNGPFKDVFDFLTRVNLGAVNRRVIENLALGGAMDSIPPLHRAQYFEEENPGSGPFIERLVRWGTSYQNQVKNAAPSLFGETNTTEIAFPNPPDCSPWNPLAQLKKEKEITGFYLSGHPLDDFSFELKRFCNRTLSALESLQTLQGHTITVGGIVGEVTHRTTKTGKPFGILNLEDLTGNIEIALFGDDYLKFKPYLETGLFVFVRGLIQPRFRDSDQLEFKVQHMELLNDLRAKRLKELHCSIKLENVNSELISSLSALAKEHPGETQIRLRVSHSEAEMVVFLESAKLSVNPEDVVFEKLQAIPGLSLNL
ncbi:MAG: DNA polymerase III subunit alpha [Bacteroidetes bacterium]|nr:DNA polymerase III subunit alpha [Bacteroidota bacterium]